MSGRSWMPSVRCTARRTLPRGTALLLAVVLVALSLPLGFTGAWTSPSPAQAVAPVVAGTGSSNDGRITLTVTSSAGAELPATGSTVTLTYQVKNTTSQPAYYRSLTDSACSTPGYAAAGGMSNDGSRWWIPTGGTATFTCGFLVTQDVTSVETALFDTAPDATSGYSTSTATAATTIAVADDPCKTIWYSAENAPITGTDAVRTGTLGVVDTTRSTSPPYTRKFTVSAATGGAANGSSAFAIDPTSPSQAYFIGNLNGGLVGLFRIDLGSGKAVKISGITPATTTYRLAGSKDGTLWSWATDGNLYSMAAGSTSWVQHPIASVKDVKGQALATTSPQSGDLAVGGNGNLWLLGADQSSKRTYLIVVPAAQATPSSTTSINATLVGQMTNAKNGGFYNGIDFGADGPLYASTGPNSTSTPDRGNNLLYDVDMTTGASTLVGEGATTNVGSVGDLGSCALPRSELRVLKTVSTATPSVRAGDLITYTVRVANLGKLASVGATLSDAIPANTMYVANSTTLNGVAVADAAGRMPYESTSPRTEVHSAGANPGVVAAGATATVRFTVKVGNDLTGVTAIRNQATAVDVNGEEKSDDPNRPGGGDSTDVPIAKAGIAVTKSANTTSVVGSGDVTYTFVVTNTGTSPWRASGSPTR